MAMQWQQGYATAQSWTGRDWMNAPGNLGVDPYLLWAETTRFQHLGGRPSDWVSVILEVTTSAKQFAAAVAAQPWIRIHPRYANPPPSLAGTTFCTALVSPAFFQLLHAGTPPLDVVKRFELGQAIVPPSYLEPRVFPAPPAMAHVPDPEATRVVGIIDDGFAFAHARFRKPNGRTRIDFLWDQGYFSLAQTSADYGREFTNANIDDYVGQAANASGGVYEDVVYQHLAQYREVRRRIAHGTIVADVACGDAPSHVTADSPRMVCVQLQLPSRKTRDRSGGWLAVRVLDGLRYILDRAEAAAPGKPVVINLSFGNIAGPHDGSAMIEGAIDELLTALTPQKLAVVFAVGNSNLSRCHGQFDLSAGGTHVMKWRVLPDDPTPNFMEIWLQPNRAVNVIVTTPAGDTSPPIAPGDVYVWGPPGGPALCTAVYRNPVATGDMLMVLLAVSPTTAADRTQLLAPSGEWKVKVVNASGATFTVDAWIQRDETPFNFPRHGRQSRFEDPAYVRFETPGVPVGPVTVQGRVLSLDPAAAPGSSYVKREGTMNSLATGSLPLVVGGYRLSDGVPAAYSSSGPSRRSAVRPGPDAAAASDDSPVRHGLIAAGARSGSAVAMDGTSVSAAATTRWAAAHMPVDRGTLRAKALADDPARPSKPPPNRIGDGRIITPRTTRVPR